MRAVAVLGLFLLLTLSVGAVYVQPIRAQYTGSITINSDGSITPSNATIQQTGNIYTLTSDIRGAITIYRNNTVIDGKGYTLLGDGDYESGAVELNGVTNTTVRDFIIPYTGGQTIGISLINTSNALVTNNSIAGFQSIQAWNGGWFMGISISGGSSNVISKNSISDNLCGIGVIGSSCNLIIENNITSEPAQSGLFSSGIIVNSAYNNSIYHNAIINHTYQVRSSDSVNLWDDGYPNGGNYWSDYMAKNPNADARSILGIYNFPYVIDLQNRDRYPLVKPFNSVWYANQTVSPKVTVLSPVTKIYNGSDVALVFAVDRAVNWEGYSLDGKPTVTITGNDTIANITNGQHTITFYANSTWGTMGTSETVSFTIAGSEPFPTATLVVTLGVAAVVVGVGLIVYSKKRSRHQALK